MLNRTSLTRLRGVDQRLVDVIKAASEISEVPFQVSEGLRTRLIAWLQARRAKRLEGIYA